MKYLFEKQDSLNTPVECFVFDASREMFPIKPHWHYFAEFIFMLKGSAEMNCNDKTYIVNEGEFIIMNPSSVHSIFSNQEELPIYAVLKFDLAKFPSTASNALSLTDIFKYARSENMQIHFDSKSAEDMKCREIFFDCINEINNYSYGFDVILRSQIYRLIFGIVRKWISKGLNIDKCPVNSKDSYGIENITEYIDSHLEDSISVNDIANACHLSYSGFAAKFREQYAMSCKEYILQMRIFKAEEYLLFTDLDLNYISHQIGFSDCSHFIRSFKKYRGITPKQFRLQKKKSSKKTDR